MNGGAGNSVSSTWAGCVSAGAMSYHVALQDAGIAKCGVKSNDYDRRVAQIGAMRYSQSDIASAWELSYRRDSAP